MTYTCIYCRRIIGTTDKDEATKLIDSVCNLCIDAILEAATEYHATRKAQR